jgi:hypothetical protein
MLATLSSAYFEVFRHVVYCPCVPGDYSSASHSVATPVSSCHQCRIIRYELGYTNKISPVRCFYTLMLRVFRASTTAPSSASVHFMGTKRTFSQIRKSIPTYGHYRITANHMAHGFKPIMNEIAFYNKYNLITKIITHKV